MLNVSFNTSLHMSPNKSKYHFPPTQQQKANVNHLQLFLLFIQRNMKRTSSTLPPFHCFPLAVGIIIFDRKNGKGKNERSWGLHEAYYWTLRSERIQLNIKHHVLLSSIYDVRERRAWSDAQRKMFTCENATRWKLFQWNFPFSASRIASHRRRLCAKCLNVFGMANLI